jgi:hypothetical protein
MSGSLQTGVRLSPETSSILNFRPPSNGIPAGWVFENGTVSSSSDTDGWWARLRQSLTGAKQHHDALPTILLMQEMASTGSMESGKKDEINIIVGAKTGNYDNTDQTLGQGSTSWAGDFVLNGNKKADPNGKISIKI